MTVNLPARDILADDMKNAWNISIYGNCSSEVRVVEWDGEKIPAGEFCTRYVKECLDNGILPDEKIYSTFKGTHTDIQDICFGSADGGEDWDDKLS